MSKYKYPYIQDKKMYAAVMYACKFIRETGWFNKATETAADYYDVDVDELRRHVRARQSAGQKNAPKRKYKYYIVQTWEETCEGSQHRLVNTKIKKALNVENANETFKQCDTGSYYDSTRYTTVYGEYETKQDAEEQLDCLKRNVTEALSDE